MSSAAFFSAASASTSLWRARSTCARPIQASARSARERAVSARPCRSSSAISVRPIFTSASAAEERIGGGLFFVGAGARRIAASRYCPATDAEPPGALRDHEEPLARLELGGAVVLRRRARRTEPPTRPAPRRRGAAARAWSPCPFARSRRRARAWPPSGRGRAPRAPCRARRRPRPAAPSPPPSARARAIRFPQLERALLVALLPPQLAERDEVRVLVRLEPHEELLLAHRRIGEVPARIELGELRVQRRIGRLAPERLRRP